LTLISFNLKHYWAFEDLVQFKKFSKVRLGWVSMVHKLFSVKFLNLKISQIFSSQVHFREWMINTWNKRECSVAKCTWMHDVIIVLEISENNFWFLLFLFLRCWRLTVDPDRTDLIKFCPLVKKDEIYFHDRLNLVDQRHFVLKCFTTKIFLVSKAGRLLKRSTCFWGPWT